MIFQTPFKCKYKRLIPTTHSKKDLMQMSEVDVGACTGTSEGHVLPRRQLLYF